MVARNTAVGRELPDEDDVAKDEYALSLEAGIEDETLLERPSEREFSIESYGADYTVDSLVRRMRQGAFKIPAFQRKFVWTIKHSSKFIESLLMGLPVPGIFLYKEADTNQHLVIDGQQRLETLRKFYDNKFENREFRLVGVRASWEGKTYDDLESSDILKLDDAIVHATIFKQDEPKNVLDSIYYVFERINTGGIRLSPQEIRNCIIRGPFTEFVTLLNKNKDWRNIFGKTHKRAKDEELIVRFLALIEEADVYTEPMNDFLNDFSSKMNCKAKDEIESVGGQFVDTICLVNSAIGKAAFRPQGVLNAAVFDSVMVGLARRRARAGGLDANRLRMAYDQLLQNAEYLQLCARSTADPENVHRRIALATDAFSEV